MLQPIVSGFVQFNGSQIQVKFDTVEEGRIVLKELRLKKKEYNIIKRSIAAEAKTVRSQYTQDVRNRGSMVRGGGGIGRFFRVFQSMSRDNRRVKLANDLAPLESKQAEANAIINAIEMAIVRTEFEILKMRNS